MAKKPEIGLGLCGYILPHGPGLGAERPALIVKVLEGMTVRLAVFTAPGDELPQVWPAQATYDESRKPGTWHRLSDSRSLEGKAK